MKNKCKFCNIVKTQNSKKILFQDEKILMFSDYRPICLIHLQCIPKIHIKNIKSLTPEHIPLLLHMKEKAIKFLVDKYKAKEKDIVMGFHVPPFNSIDHLHMHCMLPPFKDERTRTYNCNLIMRKIDEQINILQKQNIKIDKESK